MKLIGDVLLDPQIVQLSLILSQKTGDRFGVANNRAGDEVTLLTQGDNGSSEEQS
jgi:hypothetical protein